MSMPDNIVPVVNNLLGCTRSVIGRFPHPHWLAVLLDNPIRRALEDPVGVTEMIGLSGNEQVLELGPGPGYFSIEIARRLTTGHLDLVDIQPQMLQKARQKLKHAGINDVDFHIGDASAELSFPDNTFDVAFLASVLGEIPDRSGCLRALARVLKSGGELIFYEGFPDPDRLSVNDLRRIAEPEGFKLAESRSSRWKDLVRFTKNAAP